MAGETKHFARGDTEMIEKRLWDLLDPTTTDERDAGDLARRGLYLDLPAWGYHVFGVTARG